MANITIKEIARICGVGVSTVSRAINGYEDINEETKEKILKVIKEYNYVPNNSARNLKLSDSNSIAVLIKGISNPFFAQMIQILNREITKKEYTFILQHVGERENEIDVALRLEKEKRLKGIVFLGGVNDDKKDKLKLLTVPFVISTSDSLKIFEEYASVTIDHEKESMKMTEYLLQCGYRKIAILAAGEEDASIGLLRLNGYLNALKKHEMEPNEKCIIQSVNEEVYTMKNGYKQTKRLLESGVDFDCIYAISDSMAIGACKALVDAGKNIPAECGVAGFDGLEMTSYYNPTITTMKQPSEEMAMATIQMLFEMINSKSCAKQIILDAELVIGDSTKINHHQ
ncbi:MAG: LacI family DNA-binding transcriptional regulator [Eubacteriales bacterium]|nr:LacI family DNA-binding transcriptional regulator [Eubacteriales bacterium]